MRRILYLIVLLSMCSVASVVDAIEDHVDSLADMDHDPKDTPTSFEKASDAINDYLIAQYSDKESEVRYSDVFNALGALAGFGCQMAIREAFIKPGIMTEEKAFVIIKTTDGNKYFFGDFLNIPLLATNNNQISVWSLVVAGVQKAEVKNLPDIKDIMTYDIKTLGTKDFGIPRIPEQYRSREMPIDILRKDWPYMQKLLVDYKVDPRFWGWTFALSAQHLILKNKYTFDPEIAAKIIMETAIPMSHVNPMKVTNQN